MDTRNRNRRPKALQYIISAKIKLECIKQKHLLNVLSYFLSPITIIKFYRPSVIEGTFLHFWAPTFFKSTWQADASNLYDNLSKFMTLLVSIFWPEYTSYIKKLNLQCSHMSIITCLEGNFVGRILHYHKRFCNVSNKFLYM